MKSSLSVDVLCMSSGKVIRLQSATFIQPEKPNICSSAIYCKPDGGIMVSEYLMHLGAKGKLYGFLGGFAGQELQWYCESAGLDTFFVKTGCETSIKVLYGYGKGKETPFIYNGHGNITMQEYFKLLHAITDNESFPEYFIITGTRPNGLFEGVYADIVKILNEKGVKVIANFSSQELKLAEKQRPWMIITDFAGVAAITGAEVENKAQALSALKKYSKTVNQKVLCICKKTGAVYSEGKMLMLCDSKARSQDENLYYNNAFTAAFMKAYEYSLYDVEYAVRYACAFANVTDENGGYPQKSDIRRAFNQTAIKTYDVEK